MELFGCLVLQEILKRKLGILHFVKIISGYTLHPVVSTSIRSLCQNNLSATFPFVIHSLNQLNWVLEVNIHRNHNIAATVL